LPSDEFLGRLLAVVSCIVVAVRGEKLRGFRVLLREVEERLEPLLLSARAGPRLTVYAKTGQLVITSTTQRPRKQSGRSIGRPNWLV